MLQNCVANLVTRMRDSYCVYYIPEFLQNKVQCPYRNSLKIRLKEKKDREIFVLQSCVANLKDCKIGIVFITYWSFICPERQILAPHPIEFELCLKKGNFCLQMLVKKIAK